MVPISLTLFESLGNSPWTKIDTENLTKKKKKIDTENLSTDRL